jgi:hypothetical protein
MDAMIDDRRLLEIAGEITRSLNGSMGGGRPKRPFEQSQEPRPQVNWHRGSVERLRSGSIADPHRMGHSQVDRAGSGGLDRIYHDNAGCNIPRQRLAGWEWPVSTERILFVIATGIVLVALSASITSQVIDRAREMETSRATTR